MILNCWSADTSCSSGKGIWRVRARMPLACERMRNGLKRACSVALMLLRQILCVTHLLSLLLFSEGREGGKSDIIILQVFSLEHRHLRTESYRQGLHRLSLASCCRSLCVMIKSSVIKNDLRMLAETRISSVVMVVDQLNAPLLYAYSLYVSSRYCLTDIPDQGPRAD